MKKIDLKTIYRDTKNIPIVSYLETEKINTLDIPPYLEDYKEALQYVDVLAGLKSLFITSAFPSLKSYGKDTNDSEIEEISDKGYDIALNMTDNIIGQLKTELNDLLKHIEERDNFRKYFCFVYLLDSFCSLKDMYKDKDNQLKNYEVYRELNRKQAEHKTILKRKLLESGADTLLKENLTDLDVREEILTRNESKPINDV